MGKITQILNRGRLGNVMDRLNLSLRCLHHTNVLLCDLEFKGILKKKDCYSIL